MFFIFLFNKPQQTLAAVRAVSYTYLLILIRYKMQFTDTDASKVPLSPLIYEWTSSIIKQLSAAILEVVEIT